MAVVMRVVCHIHQFGHNTREHDRRVENEDTLGDLDLDLELDQSFDLGGLAVDHNGYEQMDQSMVTPLLARLMVAHLISSTWKL